MKAKKIIIIALSALVVALIVALVSVSIAAGNENLSIAEYFAKIAKNEKLDESTLVTINGEEKSIESFEKLIRVYSALDAVFDSEKLHSPRKDRSDKFHLHQSPAVHAASSPGLPVSQRHSPNLSPLPASPGQAPLFPAHKNTLMCF